MSCFEEALILVTPIPRNHKGGSRDYYCSVTRKKSPNVYKSYPKMISLEKLKIMTPLQKNSSEFGRFGQINCCQRL